MDAIQALFVLGAWCPVWNEQIKSEYSSYVNRDWLTFNALARMRKSIQDVVEPLIVSAQGEAST